VRRTSLFTPNFQKFVNKLKGAAERLLVVYLVKKHGSGLLADSAVATSERMIPFRKMIVSQARLSAYHLRRSDEQIKEIG
jgi:hypothetical protein